MSHHTSNLSLEARVSIAMSDVDSSRPLEKIRRFSELLAESNIDEKHAGLLASAYAYYLLACKIEGDFGSMVERWEAKEERKRIRRLRGAA